MSGLKVTLRLSPILVGAGAAITAAASFRVVHWLAGAGWPVSERVAEIAAVFSCVAGVVAAICQAVWRMEQTP
jgi:hypothetical protein